MIAGAFARGEVARWGLRNKSLSFLCRSMALWHKPDKKLPTENNMKELNSAMYRLKVYAASETSDGENKNP